jgi:hypothetical protein
MLCFVFYSRHFQKMSATDESVVSLIGLVRIMIVLPGRLYWKHYKGLITSNQQQRPKTVQFGQQ